MHETIQKYMPDFRKYMLEIPDTRKKPKYDMADVIFSAVSMFFFKSESRNGFNEARNEEQFCSSFSKIFGFKAPHMDTVDGVLKNINPELLEIICQKIIAGLVEKRVFHPFRLLSKYLTISIDGTGCTTFAKETEGTIKKEYKSGKKVFYRSNLQAKFVFKNGFSLPLTTEWIETLDGSTKQDCELNCFKRIAAKIKKIFPKLEICLILDGLYANETVLSICHTYNWQFAITLKNQSLKTLWREIYDSILDVIYPVSQLISPDGNDGGYLDDDYDVYNHKTNQKDTIFRTLEWLNNLNYRGFDIHWLGSTEYTGEKGNIDDLIRYAWITSFRLDKENVVSIEEAIRAGRAGIEDSFNTEKRRGYNMTHKYSRTSFKASKNYVSCMHIAEIINQLITVSHWFKNNILTTEKSTLKSLWKSILSTVSSIDTNKIANIQRVLPRIYNFT